MYRKDYFLKLVQQFSKVLTRLMGFKESGELEKAKEVINEAYRDFFEIDRGSLLNLSSTTLMDGLINDNKLNEEQLELLAKLLMEDADINDQDAQVLNDKALFIFEYLNEKQRMYSFEREVWIKKLRCKLNE